MAGSGVELVWEGKRKEVERVPLPFQRVEIINESRATRRAAPLFSTANPGIGPQLPPDPLWASADAGEPALAEAWRNKLIWGDNKYVLASLLEGDPAIGLEPLAGKVDLIYIDPPFATGADFSFTARVGDDAFEVAKEQSGIEEMAYRDTWGRGLGSYYQMLYDRLILLRELLAANGSIFVHVDPFVGPSVRLLLDERFGAENFVNEVVWKRQTAKSGAFQGLGQYGRIHELILFYSRSTDRIWNQQYEAYDESYVAGFYKYRDPDTGHLFQLGDLTAAGTRRGGSGAPLQLNGETVRPAPGRHWALGLRPGESVQQALDRLAREGRIWHEPGSMPRLKRYLDEMPGVLLQDVWTDIRPVAAQSTERLDYATQKPETLLSRILAGSSNEGNIVLDCFCGSGTTMAVAEKLGRRWIGCDLGRFAIHTSRKRLLEIPGCRPFEVLNLGRYQRRYWQGVELGERIQEYLRFIVELYHAQAMLGFAHLHGRKGDHVVHVGATDAPVTAAEVRTALQECRANGFRALDVLGWEWEMGLNAQGLHDLQREFGVDVRLFHIPHEVMDKRAVEAGDVHFYEAAYVEAAPRAHGRTVQVELTDFLVAIDDYVRDKVGDKVKKWSDWIDYWAVDFDFQGDTFHNQWQAYRTRKEPRLELASGAHTWTEGGHHRLLVKVVDIFGNDTTALLELDVE